MSPTTWSRAGGFFCAIALAVLLSATIDAQNKEDKPTGKKYALLVGVTEYDSANFDRLNYSDNDAEKMEVALKKAGFVSVRVLTSKRGKNDAPTTANIQAALKELLAKKTREDTVLVGLAGHGMQLEVLPDKGRGEPKQYSYFCPKDASLQGADYATGRSDRLLLLDDLFKQLGESDAGHRLVLIDACRNDVRARKRAKIDVSMNLPDRVAALFSCGRGQLAYETEKLKHGVFFHYVIKGIEGEAKNRKGFVTWTSLVDYVVEEVPAYVTTKVGNGARQVPASTQGHLEGIPVLASYGLGVEESANKDKQEKQNIKNKPLEKQPVEDKPLDPTLVLEDKARGFKLEFVLIPPTGKDGFLMGATKQEQDQAIAAIRRIKGKKFDDESMEDWFRAEGPRHRVVLTKPFYMGKFEITQKQFKALMGRNPSNFSQTGKGKGSVRGFNTEDFPVENVSWSEVQEFIQRLGKLPEAKANCICRLPTEAEWEWACRGRSGLAPFNIAGKPSTSLSAQDANFKSRVPFERTRKVGSYPANAFGLHDMHGNVMEWCHDAYDENAYRPGTRINPFVDGDKDANRVIRGGSTDTAGPLCRAAHRGGTGPTTREDCLGFRVVAFPRE